MKRFYAHLFTFIFFIIASLSIQGCTVKGTIFQKVDNVPSNKGLVYIYRPAQEASPKHSQYYRFQKYFSQGYYFKILANEEYIGKIKENSYIYYLADPGKVRFKARPDALIFKEIDVKPGKTYYIRATSVKGAMQWRPSLKVVDKETGESEIANCRLYGYDYIYN